MKLIDLVTFQDRRVFHIDELGLSLPAVETTVEDITQSRDVFAPVHEYQMELRLFGEFRCRPCDLREAKRVQIAKWHDMLFAEQQRLMRELKAAFLSRNIKRIKQAISELEESLEAGV